MSDSAGLFEVLSPREFALLVWTLAFAAWALAKAGVRRAAAGVVRAFVQPKILLSVLGLWLNASLIIYSLDSVGLWDRSLAKDAVLWLLGGIGALVAAGTATQASVALADLAKGTLKWTVVVEFVLNFYSLPLWAELVTLPIVAIAVAARTYAEYHAEHRAVIKPIDGCLALYALLIVGATVWHFRSRSGEFLSIGSLEAFLLPIALALGTMPFLYAFVLVLKYELAFLRLRWLVVDNDLQRFAKRALVKKFNIRLRALESWLNGVSAAYQATTRGEVLEILSSRGGGRRAA